MNFKRYRDIRDRSDAANIGHAGHSVPAWSRADQLYTSIQILECLDLDILLDLDMNIYVFYIYGEEII